MAVPAVGMLTFHQQAWRQICFTASSMLYKKQFKHLGMAFTTGIIIFFTYL